jgi:SAM-dependent methyltransferase
MTTLHPDPYRDVDAQPDPAQMGKSLEERGRAASHRRLLQRFLAFAGVRPGAAVLEVGCGTGVVLRQLAARVGPRGRVVGVDPSRAFLAAAARILRGRPERRRIVLKPGDGAHLPFADGKFDATLAVTVLLHVADPLVVVKEMARVTRPGGLVGLQDQDFGTVALTHSDRVLTERIMGGVVGHMYEEPCSGRRLPGLLLSAGLERPRLQTTVYQDTTLEPWTKSFLERRAANAVRFGLVDAGTAQRWLDALTATVAAGAFVLTINYYGAVGVKPRGSRRTPIRAPRRHR